MIHVVEDGRIVESGSHARLLALNGRYVDVSDLFHAGLMCIQLTFI
jgi:ABC-type multidrug transport system fused ATPase/permease subunit